MSTQSRAPAAADVAAGIAAAIGVRCGSARPAVAIVLGSGLGGFGEHIEHATRLRFADVPGVPRASVPGHAGELIHGMLGGREIVALSGRVHLYEGHGAEIVGLPIRVVHALGARTLLLTNAAGAIRADLRPGDLMLIRDHLNLAWRNPLIGPVQPGETRFPDMSAPYDEKLGDAFQTAARAAGARVSEGVYAAMLGPSYETPAEVRMLEQLGADAVGMSTVPEVLVARALGMRVVAVSCITNAASGVTAARLSHGEVLAVTARAAPIFERAVRDWVLAIGD